jgi:hypothetical protein
MDRDQGEQDQAEGVQASAERVLKLADELEAHGDVRVGGTDLDRGRAALHAWIDRATGFVVTPAFGRVTIIHGAGRQSTIASAELPYLMSDPVGPATDD